MNAADSRANIAIAIAAIAIPRIVFSALYVHLKKRGDVSGHAETAWNSTLLLTDI